MKRDTVVCLLVAIFIGLATWSSTSGQERAQAHFPEGHLRDRKGVSLARLPLSFEQNEGQVNLRAKFLARGQGYTLFLTRGDAVLQLSKPGIINQRVSTSPAGLRSSRSEAEPSGLSPDPASLLPFRHISTEHDGTSSYFQTSDVVDLKLLGANLDAKIAGQNQLPGYTSYFLGNNPRDWHTHIPNYARVRYHEIYPGIDLVYYGRQGQLESDFVLSPGASSKSIRLGLKGVESIKLEASGDLALKVSGGEIYLRKPKAYQGRGAERKEVPVHYVLRAGNQVGFGLGAYNHRQQLVIDPVLTYSTYLGGNGGDIGYGIAVDSSGNAYVTGTTASLNFPTTSGGSTSFGGGKDIFVTKLNSAGNALLYSVFMGGGNTDTAQGIAVDASGNAYVVGYTASSNFPTTSGAFQTSLLGSANAFVAKLDPQGSSLVYSTYLGGSGYDYGRAIAVDSSGDAFITGSTQSTNFPTMNPLQIGLAGGSDAFLSELNPTGTALLYSTYLGGTGSDEGLAIALDSQGNPYIAGYTFSTNFPTQSAFQPTLSGTSDAFLTEVNPETSSLVFSTYLGGSGLESAQSIALDSTGNIYVAGNTTSDDFPVTPGAFQATNHGSGDAFVAKLSPGAGQVVYGTYLGGSGSDQANGIAIDSSGDAFVTGFTQSSDFPLVDALQRVLGISGASSCGSTLCSDAFVSELGPSGNVIYSTFLGGSAADLGRAVAVDSSSDAIVTGNTSSANFPVIAGAPQATFAGSSTNPNVFVAKIGPQDAPAVALSPQSLNFGNQALNVASDSKTVTLVNAGSSSLGISGITASGEFSQTNNCGTVVSAGGGTCTIQVTFTPTQTGAVTDQISIADNAAGSPQTITVTGSGVTSAGTLTPSPSSLAFSAQTVGTTSPTQTVQLVNTGNTAVNLTAISVSGDFAETDTCGTLPTSLNVGAACSATVSFTPTATGTRSGSLTFEDNAENGPQTVALTGTGNPVFTLSANAPSSVLLIGTKTTTFTITTSAPSTFTNSINLACSGGTCSFNPATVTPGESSTVTVSGLSASSANPLDFKVTGTSGSQTASVALSIFFQDFSLSQTAPTPPLATVTAGQSVTYTVTVTPINGFNQVVLLGCSNLPQGTDSTPQKPDTTCTFSPPGLTLNGTSPVTSKLTISTTAQKSSSLGPDVPRGVPPPGRHLEFEWWTLLAVLCIFSAASVVLIGHRVRGGTPARLRTSFAVLIMAALLAAFVAACNNTYVGPTTTPVTTGTPSGTYTVNIIGSLGSNSSIKRTTSVNLSVQP